jgi:hypothetical protein
MSSSTLDLWGHVFGSERGTLAVWSGERRDKDIIRERTKYFDYPAGAQDAAEHAREESETGRETYFCTHLLTARKRVKGNAAPVRTLWGEFDGPEVPNGDLKPTALVESSPQRFHAYWRLTDAVPPEIAEGLNRRIAAATDADPSGFDLSQLLRVPGTVNHKYKDRPVVRLVGINNEHEYVPADLHNSLPLIEEPSRNGTGKTGASETDDEPPVKLDDRGLRVYRGEDPKLADSGKIDRSGSLLKIGRSLYDAGANRAVIEEALRERDQALGWKKYSGRDDAGARYAEIVDELETNGRNRKMRTGSRKARGETRNTSHSTGEEDAPKIQVNGRHLREVSADTLDALQLANNPPEIFVRSGALVRVREDEHGTPQIQNMDLNHLRGRADRCADFLRVTKRDEKWIETKVNPPEVVMKDVMALSSWPFPALEAVVEAPILRPDGTIFDTPGYDPKTRLYYRPAGDFEFPDISREPGKEEIRKALELVNEAIGEFPYADKASAANTLGLMLTPLVRQAIPGPVPLALIDKPQAGTGGSLLAETVSVIGSGRTAEMLGAPKDDEEWRKQITAKLSAGGTMVTVDNVEGALYAPSLARALTARTWTDRILGRSETVTVSQRATWVATGNNIVLRGDLPRRCYWIRLDAKDSRPWQRENFKHSDLLSWVSNSRGRLVHALLTIARAWFVAGKPKAENLPRLGSFETWTEIVGGMVTFAGIPGFLDNLSELYDKADEGGAEWEAFLSEWWRQRGEDSITVKDLTALLEDEKQFREALPGDLLEAWDKSKGSFTRRLGNALSKRAGTRYGDEGLHVSTAGEFRRAKLWSVQEGSEECEFVSFVSLYNPSASKNREEKQGTSHKVAGEEPENNSTNSQTHTDGEWEKSY